MIDPLLYLWLLLKASLFSTGGTGNMPSIYADFTARGWAEERHFAEALAIGQISPGPTGFWVVSFGYLVDGVRGALLATVAMSLPPFLVIAVDALYKRIGNHPAVEGFVRGVGLAVAGSFLVVIVTLLRETGIEWRSLGIALVVFLAAASKRVPPPLIFAAAAAAGIALY
jgi:chromate transporter